MAGKANQSINGRSNIQVGNDFHGNIHIHNYGDDEKEEETSTGIIHDLLELLLKSSHKKRNGAIQKNNDKKIVHLKQKIKINCENSDNEKRIKEMFRNIWSRKNEVEIYLAEYGHQARVNDLKEALAAQYYRLRKQKMSFEEAIEEITRSLVPETKRHVAEYLGSAKAIVLYFFEYCDLGKKTLNEEKDARSPLD